MMILSFYGFRDFIKEAMSFGNGAITVIGVVLNGLENEIVSECKAVLLINVASPP
jgi:hypothetical protein